MLFLLFLLLFAIAIFLFIIISIVLFIWDGIRAKREGTGRKQGIVVMFIISMTITALVVICGILFYILGILFMRSM